MITVREILIQRLRAMGADGLAGDDCGCGIDNLMPCESGCLDCVPALAKKDVWVPIGVP